MQPFLQDLKSCGVAESGELCVTPLAPPHAVRGNPVQNSEVLIPISAHAIKHGLSFYGLYKRKCMTNFLHLVF